MHKLYQSTKVEHDRPVEGIVQGDIPSWVSGSLYRNGPGLYEFGEDKYNHMFDPLAMFQRFQISNKKVTYQSRYLQSNSYKLNSAAQRIVVSSFGTVRTPDPCHNIFKRCSFIVVSDRHRLAWKTKMAVLQMISIYLFSIIYSTIPMIVWVGQNEKVSECSHIITHGKNSEKIFAFLGIGIFLPIVMLNILYFVTSCKLRKQWRKRKRFLRQEDSFAKENSCAEMSIMRHINQQRRDKQGEKIKSCDSPKHQPQVQVLLTPSRSVFTDYRPSALLDTTPEPNDLNTSAKPVEVPSSVKTTALPKCESTNFGKNPDPVSTRSGDTPKRFSRLNRGYRSDYQRQSLHLIGLILLLIDVTMFPAIIVRSIPISISFTVRFYLGLVVFNNSLVNPWLYALQSKDFRRALKDNLVKIGGWFACSGGF